MDRFWRNPAHNAGHCERPGYGASFPFPLAPVEVG
jgi:hypothetical protein